MSSPLCLDLGKYGATEHSCGCLIACPFADVKALLGLHAMPPRSSGEGATGIAHYTARGQRYTVRAVAHTRRNHPSKCCFHLEYEVAEDKDTSPSQIHQGISIAKLDGGLAELFGSCESDERKATSGIETRGSAPVLGEITVPAKWPAEVAISGANLTEPNGKAHAIIQAGNNMVFVSVAVGGGKGLSPKQVRAGFLITTRLAEAFRDGRWDVTEKGVQAYEQI